MHRQAAINTVKILASALVCGLVGFVVVETLSVKTLLTILGVGVMGYLVYIFYSIEKSRLESLERLNKTVDR